MTCTYSTYPCILCTIIRKCKLLLFNEKGLIEQPVCKIDKLNLELILSITKRLTVPTISV